MITIVMIRCAVVIVLVVTMAVVIIIIIIIMGIHLRGCNRMGVQWMGVVL